MDALLKIRLTNENGVIFGPGTLMLFDAIDRTGSVRAAAEDTGMSYSKAWKIIRDAERNTGMRLVERSNGGKDGGAASITEDGRKLIGRYIAIRDELEKAKEEIMGRLGC